MVEKVFCILVTSNTLIIYKLSHLIKNIFITHDSYLINKGAKKSIKPWPSSPLGWSDVPRHPGCSTMPRGGKFKNQPGNPWIGGTTN